MPVISAAAEISRFRRSPAWQACGHAEENLRSGPLCQRNLLTRSRRDRRPGMREGRKVFLTEGQKTIERLNELLRLCLCPGRHGYCTLQCITAAGMNDQFILYNLFSFLIDPENFRCNINEGLLQHRL